MHLFISGIGGTGLGPLALIAKQAGYEISGSDSVQSQYTDYLQKNGIKLYIGQTMDKIATEHAKNPIDWIVFSSAVSISNPNHPEIIFAKKKGIKTSKRDECLNMILNEKNLKLIAIAGTHGKTTSTAMVVWLFKRLCVPISYSVGAKISFGPMGIYDPKSQYFIYECDEFDRNFLSFKPSVSVITTVDWDHHDIYTTRQSYQKAFVDFINQSDHSYLFDKDASYLNITDSKKVTLVSCNDGLVGKIKLAGLHNRQNAAMAVKAAAAINGFSEDELIDTVNEYPGSNRRFEKLTENIYTDYAHTPEEITATIQLASELSSNVVVAYEPLTDRRQHYMKDQYRNVFETVKKVYWLPSYLAREDPDQTILTPNDLISSLSPSTQSKAQIADKNTALKKVLLNHANSSDLVICMAGGGGGSLDEWARKELVTIKG